MSFFSLEHSAAADRADFVFYSTVAVSLAAVLLGVPGARTWGHAATALAGLAGWTVLEYLLHRFVLHGMAPFRDWHAAHHARPAALIGTPTLYSAMLFAGLVYLPAWLLMGPWTACALLLGVLSGYLAYAAVHHAVHHGAAQSAWLRQRQRWHAQHHGNLRAGCYGVTSGFWDRVFGSDR